LSSRAILLVDDDDALRETLREAVDSLDVDVDTAETGAEAIERVRARTYAVVVTDLVMKGIDGFSVLDEVGRRSPATRLIMLTGHGSREVAVQAMQQGATYYLEKPFDLVEFRTKVQKCLAEYRKDLDYQELRSRVDREFGTGGIIGQDPKMVRLLDVVRQIASTNASVLVLGESGTGKELVARAIHGQSPRRDKPFVALNCGGLAEGTIESELFGHV
jgi:DNA-binding NtrC family response regulator